jgi:hypothetical protein
MKILLYLDPWTSFSKSPDAEIGLFEKFISPTFRDFFAYAKLINNLDVEIKVICSEVLITGGDFKDGYKFMEFASIEQKHLKGIFDSFEDYIAKQRSGENSDQIFAFSNLLKESVNGFVPDVILSISAFSKHLKLIFPDSLILQNDAGIFNGAPFSESLYFDCGVDESFLLTHKNEILSMNCGEGEKKFLSEIRNYFTASLKKFNNHKTILESAKKKFAKVVLLPMQPFQSHIFRSQSTFKDQIEYIEYVFENVDSSIAIIVSEHSSNGVLNSSVVRNYLKNKYKNFIYIRDPESRPNYAQFLLEMADGIISVSAHSALLALLYEKPLFVPSKISYLTAFCDESDLGKIVEFLRENKYKNKDGALYYLLTRYYLLNKYFGDGEKFYNFLAKSLEKKKHGVDFSFYEKLDSDENLLKNICNPEFVKIFESRIGKVNSAPKKPRGLKKLKNSVKKRIAEVSSWF